MTKIPSDALRQAFIDYGWSMGVWLETMPRETPPSEVTHTHHSCTMLYIPFSKPFIASIPGRLKYDLVPSLLVINTSLYQNLLVLLHTHPHTPHTLTNLAYIPPTHTNSLPPTTPTHTHTHTHTHTACVHWCPILPGRV